jgi:hypothetical protein
MSLLPDRSPGFTKMVRIALAVWCSRIRRKLNVFIPGYGTVDSGHLCLSGYNEVVMLRRLPKGHDVNAIHADGKGFLERPHDEALVRISPSGVSSAHFDEQSHEPFVSGKKDFRLADKGQDNQNEVVKVSQRG